MIFAFVRKYFEGDHYGICNQIISVCRDIDVDRRCDFRIFKSMALRRVDLGRRLGLFGGSAEFQKPERQINFFRSCKERTI